MAQAPLPRNRILSKSHRSAHRRGPCKVRMVRTQPVGNKGAPLQNLMVRGNSLSQYEHELLRTGYEPWLHGGGIKKKFIGINFLWRHGQSLVALG